MSEHENLFGSEDVDDDAPERVEQQRNVKQRLQSTAARAGPVDESAAELEDDLEDDDAPVGGAYGTTNNNNSDDMDDREDDDEQGPATRAAAPAMEIEAPLIPLPPAEQLHLLKMSNILGVEPRPFDPDSFTAEEETYIDGQGVRRVKIRDDNVIRWRNVRRPDGTEERQSNTRLVRWSDGSLQLLLGDEVLDVLQQDLTINNTYLYCMRNIIQGQAQLTSRLAFRPASLESKLHKRLREAVDKRHGKLTKVAAHATLLNPVKAKDASEKAAEELIKNRENLQRRQNRVMDRVSIPRRTTGAAASSGQRLTSQYLEEDGFIDDEDDDLDGEDLTATERARRIQSDSRARRDMDEDEAARRLQNAKRAAPSASQRPTSSSRRRPLENEQSLPSDGSEEEDEESEAVSSGAGEEDEEAEEADARGGRGGGAGGSKRSSGGTGRDGRGAAGGTGRGGGEGGGDEGRAGTAAAASAKMKARRGVVLSDDEED